MAMGGVISAKYDHKKWMVNTIAALQEKHVVKIFPDPMDGMWYYLPEDQGKIGRFLQYDNFIYVQNKIVTKYDQIVDCLYGTNAQFLCRPES